MTKSDALIAIEVHRLYNELRPLLGSDAKRGLLDSLHRLVYTPPTMADIAWDDEVHAGLCAEFFDGDEVLMIGPDLDNEGVIICRYTNFGSPVTGGLLAEKLTPIPGTKIDLTPRRTHADTVTAASIEDYKAGRIVDFDLVDTPEELPRPEDVPVGEVWTVRTIRDGAWVGFRNNPSDMCPWTIVRTDRVSDEAYYMDEDITIVHRLIPEPTPDHPAVLTTREDYKNAPEGTIVADDYWDPWAKDDMGLWLRAGEDGGSTSLVMSLAPRRVLRWGEAL